MSLEPPLAFARAVMDVIHEERRRKRVTVDELVRLGGFNRSTLLRYLYEDRDVPLSALHRIATALDVDPADIVARAVRRPATTDAAEAREPESDTMFDD